MARNGGTVKLRYSSGLTRAMPEFAQSGRIFIQKQTACCRILVHIQHSALSQQSWADECVLILDLCQLKLVANGSSNPDAGIL